MFSADERKIFGPYYDGAKDHVYADPLRVRRLLTLRLEGKPNEWIARTASPDPKEKSDAVGKVVAATVEAFSLVPFDPKTGKGADELTCLETLDAFIKWQESKKSRPRSCPTSPVPTASGKPSTTVPGLASTSISTVRPNGDNGTLPRAFSSVNEARVSKPVRPFGTPATRPPNSLRTSRPRRP